MNKEQADKVFKELEKNPEFMGKCALLRPNLEKLIEEANKTIFAKSYRVDIDDFHAEVKVSVKATGLSFDLHHNPIFVGEDDDNTPNNSDSE